MTNMPDDVAHHVRHHLRELAADDGRMSDPDSHGSYPIRDVGQCHKSHWVLAHGKNWHVAVSVTLIDYRDPLAGEVTNTQQPKETS